MQKIIHYKNKNTLSEDYPKLIKKNLKYAEKK